MSIYTIQIGRFFDDLEAVRILFSSGMFFRGAVEFSTF